MSRIVHVASRAGLAAALALVAGCVESRRVESIPDNCGTDIDRANDPAGAQDRATAVPIAIPAGAATLAVAPLQICPAGDVDMYAVAVTGKLTVTIELGETDAGDLSAAVLDDVQSQPMDGAGDLTWTGVVPSAETRWIEVRGSAAATGAYGLYLLLEDTDEDIDEHSDEDGDEGSDEDTDEGSDEDTDEDSDEDGDDGSDDETDEG